MNKFGIFFIQILLYSVCFGQFCKQSPSLVELPSPLPAALLEILEVVDEQIQTVAEQQGTPSVSSIVVYNQTVIYHSGYGLANTSDCSSTPTLDTIYRIASNTKVFTSLMMMQLRDKGYLYLDEEVTRYVPEFRLNNDLIASTERSITWKQLATHLGGIPRESPCIATDAGWCDTNTTEMLTRFQNMYAILPPNTLPVYSNAGFSLLGRLLEQVVGQTWESWLSDNIIDPLGLNGTGFDITPEILQRMAVGYNPDGTVASAYAQNLLWDAPCGQMFSSARDMAKWMSLFFRDDQPADDGAQILDGGSIKEMLLPVYLDSDQVDGFAIPFELEYYGGYMTRTKRGDITGFASEIILVPELKLGIAVLVNKEEQAAPIAVPIAEMLIPEFEQVLWSLQPNPPLPNNWKQYIGNYIAEGISISIFADTAIPQLKLSNELLYSLPIPLLWKSGDVFQMTPPTQDPEDCMSQQTESMFQYIEFQRDVNGDLVSLSVPGLIYGVYFKRQ